MRRSYSRESESRKWYDNKTLLFFLILIVYPIGLVGIWMRDSTTSKKVVYSIIGFFGWFWFCVISIIFFSIANGPNDFEQGQRAMESKEWKMAEDHFKQVDMDDESYEQAQEQLKVARRKIQEEEQKQKAIKNTAIAEVKSNVDSLLTNQKVYTVILYDMDITTENSDSVFKHQYKVVREKPDGLPYDTLTNFVVVSDTTFDYYSNDLGMALISKDMQETQSYSHPPGYNRYVGNASYGQWRTGNDGNSFWEFYGRYAFMSAMFGYSRPIYQYGYNDFTSYYSGRSSYYGRPISDGRYLYGSGSPSAQKLNPTNNFKSKVQQRVNRSPSRYSSAASYRSNPNNNYTRSASRISRSPSRTSSIRGGSSSSSGGK